MPSAFIEWLVAAAQVCMPPNINASALENKETDRTVENFRTIGARLLSAISIVN